MERPDISDEEMAKELQVTADWSRMSGGLPSSFLPGPETPEEQLLAGPRVLGRLIPIPHGDQPNQKYTRLGSQELAEKIRKELDEGWESGD